MRGLLLSLAAVVLGLVCSTAQANVVSYAGVSYTEQLASTATDWAGGVTIPRYDGSLGALQSVTLRLWGSASGTGYYENMGNSPATINLTLSAQMTLTPSGGTTPIVSINPSLTQTCANVPAYDGGLDYQGTSGGTVAMVSPVVSQTVTLLPADAAFAMFQGTGTMYLDCAAKGDSIATGPGNLATRFSTNAGGSWEVDYTYVPEPATMALLALGGLGLNRRKR